MDPGEYAYVGRELRSAQQRTFLGQFMQFFFWMTTAGGLYVLAVYVFYYAALSTAWSMLMRVDVIRATLDANNFVNALSCVVWLMQGVYLKDVYDVSGMGRMFFKLVLETRSLALLLAADLRGLQCAHARDARDEVLTREEASLINRVRGLLMVYTRYQFMLFGVDDVTHNYVQFEFADEERCAKGRFQYLSMNDEAVMSVLDGAFYELTCVLAALRARNALTTAIYEMALRKVDDINDIKNMLLEGRRPLVAPVLDTIPKVVLWLYVYFLVPLTVFSSVNEFWGIPIYTLILFIYNAHNIVSQWLGTPFSVYSNYTPISFDTFRNQQYCMIEQLLGTRDVRKLRDEQEGTTLTYIGGSGSAKK